MLYSNQIVRIDNKNAFQVSIKKAERYFNEGRQLWLHPCNLRLNNAWQNPMPLSKDIQDNPHYNEASLRSIVNEFSYYNCDNERGNRVLIFVECKNK